MEHTCMIHSTEVEEDVTAAIVREDETIALFAGEELDRPWEK